MSIDLGAVKKYFKKHHFILTGVQDIGKELGRGSFGAVLGAKWHGVPCALKRLHFDIEGTILSDFIRESKVWKKLRHPHLVHFYGFVYKADSDFPILVMERMSVSLKRFIEERTKEDVPLWKKAILLHQIALGLVYLHINDPKQVHPFLHSKDVLLDTQSWTAKISEIDLAMKRIFQIDPTWGKKGGSGNEQIEGTSHAMKTVSAKLNLPGTSIIQETTKSESEEIPKSESKAIPKSESEEIPKSESEAIPKSESEEIPKSESEEIPKSESEEIPKSESEEVSKPESEEIPESESKEIPKSESEEVSKPESTKDMEPDTAETEDSHIINYSEGVSPIASSDPNLDSSSQDQTSWTTAKETLQKPNLDFVPTEDKTDQSENVSNCKLEKNTVNTSEFIPPEVFEENSPLDKVDVFSWGCLAIGTVTHVWPNCTGSESDVLPKYVTRHEYLDSFNEEECRLLLPFLRECLSDDPQKRPTIGMLEHQLSNITTMLEEEGISLRWEQQLKQRDAAIQQLGEKHAKTAESLSEKDSELATLATLLKVKEERIHYLESQNKHLQDDIFTKNRRIQSLTEASEQLTKYTEQNKAISQRMASLKVHTGQLMEEVERLHMTVDPAGGGFRRVSSLSIAISDSKQSKFKKDIHSQESSSPLSSPSSSRNEGNFHEIQGKSQPFTSGAAKTTTNKHQEATSGNPKVTVLRTPELHKAVLKHTDVPSAPTESSSHQQLKAQSSTMEVGADLSSEDRPQCEKCGMQFDWKNRRDYWKHQNRCVGFRSSTLPTKTQMRRYSEVPSSTRLDGKLTESADDHDLDKLPFCEKCGKTFSWSERKAMWSHRLQCTAGDQDLGGRSGHRGSGFPERPHSSLWEDSPALVRSP